MISSILRLCVSMYSIPYLYIFHTGLSIGFEQAVYSVSEEAGQLLACVEVLNALQLTRNVSVQISTIDGTATGECVRIQWNLSNQDSLKSAFSFPNAIFVCFTTPEIRTPH